MTLKEGMISGIDKEIASLNYVKNFSDTLDSLQNFALKDGAKPQYVDQVDKAKQLLDAGIGTIFDFYLNLRSDLGFSLDPADQKRFFNEVSATLDDYIKKFS